jgi:hypothetical protein
MASIKDLSEISQKIMAAAAAGGTVNHEKVLAAAQKVKDQIADRDAALKAQEQQIKDTAKQKQEEMIKRAAANKILQAVLQDPAVHIKSQDDIPLMQKKSARSAIAYAVLKLNGAALDSVLQETKNTCRSHSFEESYDLVQDLIKKHALQLASTPLTAEQAAEISRGNAEVKIGKRTTVKLAL